VLPNKRVMSGLIGSVYDAAADAGRWEGFLSELAQASRADSAALVMHSLGREVHAVAAAWRVEPHVGRLYQEHYGSIDVWAMRGRSKPASYVSTSQGLCSAAELATTEIYNDFLVPYGIVHGMFGVVENNATRWASLSLYREPDSGEFESSDLETMALLVPHVQRAFRLHFQFSELKARSEGVEAAFNLLSVGVIFLGAGGEVLVMNARAEELVKQRNGLLLTRGALEATVRSESALLQTLARGAALTGNGKGLSAGGTILISRQRGRPLSVTVAPLRAFNPGGSRQPSAVLFISDPDRNVELPEELLRRCYGLTQAEARLTMVMLEGCSLTEAAERCGVTHNTAKSELKIIFSKTQVRRQGELIRLLMGMAGLTGWAAK
jgi:DNA-binding CsgD family transcriptional regulator